MVERGVKDTGSQFKQFGSINQVRDYEDRILGVVDRGTIHTVYPHQVLLVSCLFRNNL